MEENIKIIFEILNSPFYKSIEFWISISVGIISMIAAIFAFLEAKGAKKAATDAGRTVKIQTITIELTEILQRLDKLEPAISYSDARDLLNEIARRLRRLASPFNNEIDLKDTITNLFNSLELGKKALSSVKARKIWKLRNKTELQTLFIMQLNLIFQLSAVMWQS